MTARILIPPPPPDSERARELPAIQRQYYRRVVPAHMQDKIDLRTEEVLNDILIANGLGDHLEYLEAWSRAIVEPIMHHKNHFNSARPHQLAEHYSIPFTYDHLLSAETPSYPSGHTTQAYFNAIMLGQMYPALRSQLMRGAETVAQSRIDRGVHFPSDNKAGLALAHALYSQLGNQW